MAQAVTGRRTVARWGPSGDGGSGAAPLAGDRFVDAGDAQGMTSRKITVFSKYFGYAVGGAEQSTLEILREAERRGAAIEVVRVDNVSDFRAGRLPMPLPGHWRVRSLSLRGESRRFKYVNYYRNRGGIARYFAALEDAGELVSYGLLAPAALNAYHGPTTYIVRDELGLGLDVNYYRGARRVARALYAASEAPLRVMWRRELHRAAGEAGRVIANSRFMARRVAQVLGRADAEVVYPYVDGEALRRRWAAVRDGAGDNEPRGVVAVGDNVFKGGDIVRGLAARCPELHFHLFDRGYERPVTSGNLTLHPWTTDPVGMYRLAEVVLVPSRWEEAYSRVAREAALLGIPVLASDVGGIPEALEDVGPGHRHALVEDLDDWSEWVDKLRSLVPGPRRAG